MHDNGFATPGTIYVHAATLSPDSYLRIAATGGWSRCRRRASRVADRATRRPGRCGPTTSRSPCPSTPACGGAATSSPRCGPPSAPTAHASISKRMPWARRSRTRHLRADQVVAWATRGGAFALGLDSVVGSLEAGKKADVILIKNDRSPAMFPVLNPYGHVAFQAQRGDVHTVLINGRVVKHDHRLVGIDLDQARRNGRVHRGVSAGRTWPAGMGAGDEPRHSGNQDPRQPLHLYRLPNGDDAPESSQPKPGEYRHGCAERTASRASSTATGIDRWMPRTGGRSIRPAVLGGALTRRDVDPPRFDGGLTANVCSPRTHEK